MRARAALASVALIVSACGSDPAPAAAPTETTTAEPMPVPTTEAVPPDTAAPAAAPSSTAPATTEAPTTTLRPRPEGEDAPDFKLRLGVGGEDGEFVLSEEQKPVYMIFWAEW